MHQELREQQVNTLPELSVLHGIDGFSPIATVTQTETGATISITDRDGTTTADIKNGKDGKDGSDGAPGAPGKDGESATISVGTTTTGNPGTNASVINSGTASAAILNFTIPRGATGATGAPGRDGTDGRDGQDGQDGYSPTASVSKSGSTATITITDKNGTTTASVSDGTNGTNGQDGFSPIATVTKSGDTATITITDKNGTTTASISDGTTPTLATVATTGSYNDLLNKPTIPTKTSDLNNDSGYLTSSDAVTSVNGSTGAVSGIQTTANLVTSVSSGSTDSQYPSAKLFYDTIGNVETILQTLNNGGGAQ